MTNDQGTPALRGLTELAQEQTERDGIAAQMEVAHLQLSAATDRSATASDALASERADVARLEDLSMTRILATLRGRRDRDLDRERAEAQAAEYAAAEAESRRRVAEAEVDGLVARLDRFDDLDARRTDLMALRESEIAADPATRPAAARLAEIAADLGAKQAEQQQLEEAAGAARAASASLQEAGHHLGRADDWATVDTFLGGGLVTDLVKYDKLDQAGRLMRRADADLAHLATELAHVGITAVGGIEITQMTGFFDVWFDNIFSDWSVRRRIQEASGRVAGARAAVAQTSAELASRTTSCTTGVTLLTEERNKLLVS